MLNKHENKTNSLIAFKAQPIDLSQDVDYENRKLRGYLSRFDIIDSDYDVIRKGAFSKSIQERGPKSTSNRQIKFLLQHEIKTPAGIFLDLYEDSKGLVYEGFVEKTASGDATLERVRIGFYREHSFGFNYVYGKCDMVKVPLDSINNPMGIDITIDKDNMTNIFECKELALHEGSIVTFGANSQTNFIEVKSEGDRQNKVSELKSVYNYLIEKAPSYDYELMLRKNFQRELSLLNSVAVVKDTTKFQEPIINTTKKINFDYLLQNF